MDTDFITEELLPQFVQVCQERLSKISEALSCEDGDAPDTKKLQDVLGQLHTLKGEADMLGLSEEGQLAHTLESCIQNAQKQKQTTMPLPLFMAGIETIHSLVEARLDKKRINHNAVQALIKQIKDHTAGEARPTKSISIDQDRQSEPIPATGAAHRDSDTNDYRLPFVHGQMPDMDSQIDIPVASDLEQDQDSLSKTDHGFKKKLAVTSVPVELKRIEALSGQIEKVGGALLLLTNVIGEFRRSTLTLKQIAASATRAYRHDRRELLQLPAPFQQLGQQLTKMVKNQESLQEQCANLLFDIEAGTEELFEQNLCFRLIPLTTLVEQFRLGVFKIAREIGKKIKLKTGGLETQLDRYIVERFFEPAIHIIRNAIDHGIESPEQRANDGKPPYGTITFIARPRGNEVEIIISDDGQGIDPEYVASQAMQKGLIAVSSVKKMSVEEKLQLVFLANFSTRQRTNQLSGRGIGLDIARRAIEKMDGHIGLQSGVGTGTTFTVTLPTTLAKLPSLVMTVGAVAICIPSHYIEEVRYVGLRDIQNIGNARTILFAGKNIVLHWLHFVIGIAVPQEHRDKLAVVILKIHTQEYSAFIVDSLLGEREILLKPFNPFFRKYIVFSGATLLKEGKLAYLLNVNKLCNKAVLSAREPKVGAPQPPPCSSVRKKILLVEDSPITREMEKTILESFGYEVIEAENGRAALYLLAQNPDLLITDIEMPELSGLDLTRHIRQNTEYHFPIIVVSTKGTREDIAAGMEVGADAYICKADFHRQIFIDTVQRWL